MKSALLVIAVYALFFPLMLNAQATKKSDIEVFAAVVKTAEWAHFDYMKNLNLAKGGDINAIKDLLEFSGTVDGAEALQHTTTCIELIPFVKDEKFGMAIYILKPKLKTVLLERFQLAQSRTKKEDLRKPFQEWAPQTWKALHGEKVVCASCAEGGLMGNSGMKKPDAQGGLVAPPLQVTDKQ